MSRRKQSKPIQLRSCQEETTDSASSSTATTAAAVFDASSATSPPMGPTAPVQAPSSKEQEPMEDAVLAPAPPSCNRPPGSPPSANNATLPSGGLFACTYCPYSFATPGALKNHEQEHAALMPYRCAICGKGFKHKRSQNRHNKLHSGLRKYKCTICDSRFFRSDHLKLHMKTHEISKYSFVCVICQRGFNSNSALESHFQVYHNKISASQDGGSAELHSANQETGADGAEESIDNSQEAVTSEDFAFLECSICHLRMPNSESLLCHLDSQHNLISSCSSAIEDHVSGENATETDISMADHVCLFCGLTFGSNDLLETHSEDVHGLKNSTVLNSLTQLALPLCGVGDVSSDHVRLRGGTVNFSCGFCAEQFGSVETLQKHTLYKHSVKDLQQLSNADPTYDCDVCGRSFDSILALHCHASSAHDSTTNRNGFDQTADGDDDAQSAQSASNRPKNLSLFQCSQCDKVSTSLKSFTAHMQYHLNEESQTTEDQQNRCDLCGLILETDLEHKSHLMSHFLQKEAHYVCERCARSYSTPDDLQKHLFDAHTIHLFRCSLCVSLHDNRNDLQIHFASSHRSEQTRYRCRSCSAVFSTDDQFLTHVNVAHLNKSSTGNGKSVGTATVVPFFCTICCLAFNTELEYRTHTHQLFKCPLCTEAFDVEYLYEKHVASVHGGQALLIAAVAAAAVTSSSAATSAQSPSSSSSSTSRLATMKRLLLSDDIKARQSSDSMVNGGIAQSGSAVSPAVTNKCNICDKKCSSVHELAEHKLQHCKVIHSEMCNVCRAPISSVEQFCAHIRMHNTSGIPMACVVCKQSLLSAVEMHTHSKFHLRLNRSAASQCQKCDGEQKDSTTRCTCVKEEPNSGEELISCQSNEEGVSESAAEGPKESSMDKPYQCIKCQRSFMTESEVQAHVTTHVLQEGVSHHCMLCKKMFDSPSKLQCHLIEHSFVGCSGFHCYLCDSVFSMPLPLQQHMMTVHSYDDRVYECTHCAQRFFFRAELDCHVFYEHTTESSELTDPSDAADSKSACCCFCGKCFSDLTLLQLHSVRCSSDVSAAPSEPTKPKRAATSTDAKSNGTPVAKTLRCSSTSHSRTQQTQGSHPCPHCPKIFNSPSALQGHSHVHMGSRIHQCSKCRREFPTAAKMRNHQRQHSGDKPFPCEVCGRYFSRKDNLKVHMKTHFKCNSINSMADLPTMVSPGTRSAMVNSNSSLSVCTGVGQSVDT